MIVDSGSSELRGKSKQEKRDFKISTIANIRSRVELFVSPYKVDSVDFNVVISHPHADHYNLVCPVFENSWMKNRKIRFLLGGKKEDYELTTEGKHLVKLVDSYCSNGRFVRDFPVGNITPLHGCQILAAPITDDRDLNAHSIVLCIKAGTIDALLTGDAVSQVTDAILKEYEHNPFLLKASIYQACHHGSTTHGSNDADFIRTVDPKYTVFSAGTKYKHPSSIVVRRILTHVCAQDDVYHILRYYHADGSEEPDDMKSDDGKKIIFKKNIHH